jgi:hypothetical protein
VDPDYRATFPVDFAAVFLTAGIIVFFAAAFGAGALAAGALAEVLALAALA